MSAILLKLTPYVAAALLLFGAGYYAGGLVPKAALARLQATDAESRTREESNALKAVQAQLAQAQTVSANNAQIVEKLQNENAQIATDRDRNMELARRLLLSAHPATPGHPVPETSDHSSIASASPALSNGSVADLLARVAAECDANAAQLNALIAEVKPQL
jgi:hypothetical protein